MNKNNYDQQDAQRETTVDDELGGLTSLVDIVDIVE